MASSKPRIMAGTMRRKDQAEMSLGIKDRKLKWKGVRELGSYALMTLCFAVLLTLCILMELILRKVSALGRSCLGPGSGPYHSAPGRSHRIWRNYFKGRCHSTGSEIDGFLVSRERLGRKQNTIWDQRIQRSEHQKPDQGPYEEQQGKRSKDGRPTQKEGTRTTTRTPTRTIIQTQKNQQERQREHYQREQQRHVGTIVIRLQVQGMHNRSSSSKKRTPTNSQLKTVSVPPTRGKSPSDNTPSSSSSEDREQRPQPETQQSDPSTPSTPPAEMPPADPAVLTNPTGNINVLRAVIPTPASAGLIFDGRGATRWVDEILAFFKDWGCSGKDRHERILRHIDITLRDDVKAIPEYTRTPFDEDGFFAALKKKYRDYDDDYTKHTRPFLDALILSAQHGRIEPKDFIELFHRVSANLKARKLLDEVEQANLFLYALPDRIRSKIVKKHNVDQDDGRTLVYPEFYKTALGVCESDEVIKRYKENHNPVMLSSKVTAVNDIMSALNASRGKTLVPPKVQPAPPVDSKASVPVLDRMFPTKFDIPKKSQDPREDLARQLEELRIAQTNAIRDVREEIGQELRAALSQNNSGYNNRGYSQGRGNGGFRGERGPGFNQRPYAPQQFQVPRDNQSSLANDTINATAVYGGFNGGGGNGSGPNCFACYNIDKDGNPEQYPHGHSDRCSQLQELIRNGVCHKNSNGRLCLGPWREHAEEIMLRRDAPWVQQIISRVRGTRYDPDVSRRPENIRREQDQVEEAAQARANANATGANAVPVRSIIKRLDTPGIPVQHYAVVDDEGGEIDDLLEDRIHACSMGVNSDSEEWTVVATNASQTYTKDKTKAKSSTNPVQTKVTKPTDWSEARRNRAELQRKVEAEAGLAQPKSRRPSAYVPGEITEPDDMTIDEIIEEVPRAEPSQDANIVKSLEEFDRILPDTVVREKPQRRIGLTTRQPKKSKGYRDLIAQLGSGYPAEAVRGKLLADLVQYRELFEVTDAARAALKSLIEGKPIVEEAVVNVQSLGLDGFVTRGWIVATPKLSVNIFGPTDVATESAMIDTGAEANVMTYELAKSLGCPILSTEKLKLRTVSGQILQFAGMAKADIEIEHGVGCSTVFFLVRETKGQTLPMVLLGQPFTQAMQMTFEHGDHGAMDAVFHDPRDHQTCTVSVVPPVKRSVRTKHHQQAYVENESSEEEN
jgi:hypothetical protein